MEHESLLRPFKNQAQTLYSEGQTLYYLSFIGSKEVKKEELYNNLKHALNTYQAEAKRNVKNLILVQIILKEDMYLNCKEEREKEYSKPLLLISNYENGELVKVNKTRDTTKMKSDLKNYKKKGNIVCSINDTTTRVYIKNSSKVIEYEYYKGA